MKSLAINALAFACILLACEAVAQFLLWIAEVTL